MGILKRSEIDSKYKWDLTKIVKDKKDFDKKYKEIAKLINKVSNYKDKITKDENTLYNFLKEYEELNNKFAKLYVYAHMNCDTDTLDSDKQSLKLRTEKLGEIMSDKLSFITPNLLKCDYNDILKLIEKNKKLEPYRFDLEKTFAYQKYTLSEKEENVIAKLNNALGVPYDVQYNLMNADIMLGNIKDENGNEIPLTSSNYNKYMKSKNRNIRENAFNIMYEFYKNHKNTFSATYKGKIKEDIALSEIRGYSSPLEASLYKDRVDIKTYQNLIDKVHDNLDKMYDYLELKRKFLNLEEMHMYDIYTPITTLDEENISYEEGKKLVLEALKPLGPDYSSLLNKAFNESWIDVYPNKGKKSGAYSWGTYGTNPYLLLNYDNTINSVSTLAHELGHSLHSYYSTHNQSYTYYDYPIILAEIASTVNEMILNNYLYEHAKTNEEKVTYLSEFLEDVRTTIYRQTMFAEFEMIMHEKEQKGIPLTCNEFTNTYYELNKLYYGDKIVSDDLIKYEWERIPHFYSSFYVYKYATGLSIAIKIAYDIINKKDNMLKKYINFLKSGCSKYPLELLKDLGIDLESGKVIDEALELFAKKKEELEKILSNK